MKHIFTILMLMMISGGLAAQINSLPTIDDPKADDRLFTSARDFAAAFRLDTLRKYFAADLVEGLAVDPWTAVPDSLRGRFFTTLADSLYYVDYTGQIIDLSGIGADAQNYTDLKDQRSGRASQALGANMAYKIGVDTFDLVHHWFAGDSKLNAVHTISKIQANYGALYGFSGPGYLSISTHNNGVLGLIPRATGSTRLDYPTDAFARYSLDGQAQELAGTSEVRIEPNGNYTTYTDDVRCTYWNYAKISYLRHPTGGEMAIIIDGVAIDTVDASGVESKILYEITGITDSTHTLTIKNISGTNYTLDGYFLRSGQKGVVVHGLANSGYDAEDFNNLLAFANKEMITDNPPDGIVVRLGTNDSSQDYTPTQFSANVARLVDTLLNYSPTADVLLLGIEGMGLGTTYSDEAYNTALSDTATARVWNYANLFNIVPDMAAFQAKGFSDDAVHENAKGSHLIGNFIFDAVQSPSRSSGISTGGTDSPWTVLPGNIYYNDGKVGIGTDSPTTDIHVNAPLLNAELRVDAAQYATFYISSDLSLTGNRDASFRFATQGVERWRVGVDQSNGNGFAIGSGSLGTTSAIFIRGGGDDRVGLGVNPQQTLDINGTMRLRTIAGGAAVGLLGYDSEGDVVDGVSFITGQTDLQSVTDVGNTTTNQVIVNSMIVSDDDKNMIIGDRAGEDLTTGANNYLLGYQSGLNITTGDQNIILGYQGGYRTTTGDKNVILGTQALFNQKTGSFNFALGAQTGQLINSGGPLYTANNSIYLGALIRASADGVTNEIAIGHNARGSGSNTATIGSSLITDTYLKGNVDVEDDLIVGGQANIGSTPVGTPTGILGVESDGDVVDALPFLTYEKVLEQDNSTALAPSYTSDDVNLSGNADIVQKTEDKVYVGENIYSVDPSGGTGYLVLHMPTDILDTRSYYFSIDIKGYSYSKLGGFEATVEGYFYSPSNTVYNMSKRSTGLPGGVRTAGIGERLVFILGDGAIDWGGYRNLEVSRLRIDANTSTKYNMWDGWTYTIDADDSGFTYNEQGGFTNDQSPFSAAGISAGSDDVNTYHNVVCDDLGGTGYWVLTIPQSTPGDFFSGTIVHQDYNTSALVHETTKIDFSILSGFTNGNARSAVISGGFGSNQISFGEDLVNDVTYIIIGDGTDVTSPTGIICLDRFTIAGNGSGRYGAMPIGFDFQTDLSYIPYIYQVDEVVLNGVDNNGIYTSSGTVPSGTVAQSSDIPGGTPGRTNLYFARPGFSSTHHTGFESEGNNETGFKLDHRVNNSGTTVSSSLKLATGAHKTTFNADTWYYDNGGQYFGWKWSGVYPQLRVGPTSFLDFPNNLPGFDNVQMTHNKDGTVKFKTDTYEAYCIRNTTLSTSSWGTDVDLTLTVPGGNYTVDATLVFEGNNVLSDFIYKLAASGTINTNDGNGYVSFHTNDVETLDFGNTFGETVRTTTANKRFQVTLKGTIKFYSGGGTVAVQRAILDPSSGKTCTFLEGSSLTLTPQYGN